MHICICIYYYVYVIGLFAIEPDGMLLAVDRY
jgi:hypothetical protein